MLTKSDQPEREFEGVEIERWCKPHEIPAYVKHFHIAAKVGDHSRIRELTSGPIVGFDVEMVDLMMYPDDLKDIEKVMLKYEIPEGGRGQLF